MDRAASTELAEVSRETLLSNDTPKPHTETTHRDFGAFRYRLRLEIFLIDLNFNPLSKVIGVVNDYLVFHRFWLNALENEKNEFSVW